MAGIALNGLTLNFQETGSGTEPLVFVHGLGWSGRMFDDQVAHLEGRYRCLTLDLRGHGGSELSPGAFDMDDLTDDVAAFIEATGAGPCHFVGFSIGGFIGLRLAAHRRQLLRSLTLIGAADLDAGDISTSFKKIPTLVRVLGTDVIAGGFMKSQFSPAFLSDPNRQAELGEYKRRFGKIRRQAIARAAESVIRLRALGGDLQAVRVPTMMINGELDQVVASKHARDLASEIPGARFANVPGAGHACVIESPAAVNAAIDSFLSSVG